MLSKKHRGLHLRNVKAAFDAGVKIACGTDWVGWPVQESVREFALLMEAGLPLFDALKCATRSTLIHVVNDGLLMSMQRGSWSSRLARQGWIY